MNAKWVMRGFYAVMLGAVLFLGGLSIKDLFNPPPVEKVEAEKPKENLTREEALDEIRDDVKEILRGKDLLNTSYWEEKPYFDAQIDHKKSLNLSLDEVEGYVFDEQDQMKIEELSNMIDVYIDGLIAWSEYKLEDSNAPKQKEKAAFLKDFYAEKVQEALDQLR